jgi:hypothetical protein
MLIAKRQAVWEYAGSSEMVALKPRRRSPNYRFRGPTELNNGQQVIRHRSHWNRIVAQSMVE